MAQELIFSDTTDNILYTLSGKWHNKKIDLFSLSDVRRCSPKNSRATRYIRLYVHSRVFGGLFTIHVYSGCRVGAYYGYGAWRRTMAIWPQQ
ncbi:hypothetical protein QUF90_03470 [Desulfococcaceae bacterium HSG9]|nr:hypothetical protein [Desulfococcaceae bacterium HSG9]